MAIESFRHKGLQELFEDGRSAKVGADMRGRAIKILDHLDAITSLDDCRGVRGFHSLTGDRAGAYAMKVTGNYRITFRWQDGKVRDVDLEDYH